MTASTDGVARNLDSVKLSVRLDAERVARCHALLEEHGLEPAQQPGVNPSQDLQLSHPRSLSFLYRRTHKECSDRVGQVPFHACVG
jgi:hypothetical protein